MSCHLGMDAAAMAQRTAVIALASSRRINRRPLAILRELRAGDCLFSEAEPAQGPMELLDGVVVLWKSLADGRRQIVDLVGPGRIFGLGSEAARHVTAQAATPVRIRQMAAQDISESPDLQARLNEELHATLMRRYDHALLLGRKTAPERMASLLLELSDMRNAREGQLFVLPLSRADMADYLGMVIETVSRTLKAFQARGLIGFESPRRVKIYRRAELCAIAGHEGETGGPSC